MTLPLFCCGQGCSYQELWRLSWITPYPVEFIVDVCSRCSWVWHNTVSVSMVTGTLEERGMLTWINNEGGEDGVKMESYDLPFGKRFIYGWVWQCDLENLAWELEVWVGVSLSTHPLATYKVNMCKNNHHGLFPAAYISIKIFFFLSALSHNIESYQL